MNRLRIAACILLLASSACRASAAAPNGDPKAEALARRVLDSMGGRQAWEGTRYVSWNFMGRRRHLWDKATGDVRYENGEDTCLWNLGTRNGRAFHAGVEVADPPARDAAVDKAYRAFINDAYWMFMPYKLEDPGVHLAYRGERKTKAGDDAEVLELTFDAVGLTPRNRYDVLVGKASGLVEEWSYYPTREDAEPKLTTPWNSWKRFGRILLCTDHGDGNDWQIGVPADVPKRAFVDPAPLPTG